MNLGEYGELGRYESSAKTASFDISESAHIGSSARGVKVARYSASERVYVDPYANVVKQINHAVSSAAGVAQSVNFAKLSAMTAHSAVLVEATLDWTRLSAWGIAQSLGADHAIEWVRFTRYAIDEQSYARVRAFMGEEYKVASIYMSTSNIEKVIFLPSTRLERFTTMPTPSQGGQAVIELKQASWYQLVFPIEIENQAVTAITDAKLVLYRGTSPELTLTLGTEMTFVGGKIYAKIDETQTILLLGEYSYELWIVDLQNNPVFVSSDYIKFLPTKTRF
jgi:hypothetical protein